jgi:hypothetical protein
VIVAVGAAFLLGRLGEEAVDRARARTAADAAALAGVTGGEPVAADTARANGGQLVSFAEAGGATEVRVRVGRATAVARARAGPSGGPDGAGKSSGSGQGDTLRSMLSQAGL